MIFKDYSLKLQSYTPGYSFGSVTSDLNWSPSTQKKSTLSFDNTSMNALQNDWMQNEYKNNFQQTMMDGTSFDFLKMKNNISTNKFGGSGNKFDVSSLFGGSKGATSGAKGGSTGGGGIGSAGAVAGIVGKVFDFAGSFKKDPYGINDPNNSAKQLKNKQLTDTIDKGVDTAANVAMNFGPVGAIVGAAMKGTNVLNKYTQKLGGGNDSMTKNSAFQNSSGYLLSSGIGGGLLDRWKANKNGMRTNTVRQSEIVDKNSDYSGISYNAKDMQKYSNKKYQGKGMGVWGNLATGNLVGAVFGNRWAKKNKKAYDNAQKLVNEANLLTNKAEQATMKNQALQDSFTTNAEDNALRLQQKLTGTSSGQLAKGIFARKGIKFPTRLYKLEEKENKEKQNIIPDGKLHAHKHNMGKLGDEFKDLSKKGIPVVSFDEGGELDEQHAEVEKGEIILHKELTEKIEDYREQYNKCESKKEKDEIKIKVGKLLTEELILNTDDKTGTLLDDEIPKHENGGILELKKGGKHWIQDAVNPDHKGYCTPMTKSTCTPRRKALARTFKKIAKARKHQEGGLLDLLASVKPREMTSQEKLSYKPEFKGVNPNHINPNMRWAKPTNQKNSVISQAKTKTPYEERQSKKAKEDYENTQGLLKTQHIWRIDPTRPNITPQNVNYEFSQQRLTANDIQGALMGPAFDKGLRLAKPITQIVTKPAGAIGRGVSKGVKKELLNAGLWDPYTTLGGRFGYYGTPSQRVTGTISRNLNIPSKPRDPELIRKSGKITMEKDGKVLLTNPEKVTSGKNYTTNFSTDRPVTSHKKGNWDALDVYVIDPKVAKGKVPISIEPSDHFYINNPLSADPKQVTLISGNPTALKKARVQGMNTLSSKEARDLYSKMMEKKKQVWEKYNSSPKTLFSKEPKPQDWGLEEYANELARLQGKRGRPTLKDYKFMEKKYNLDSGVTDKNLINDIEPHINKAGLNPVDYTFPNNENIESLSSLNTLLERMKRQNWKNVYYHPASKVEFNYINEHGGRNAWRYTQAKKLGGIISYQQGGNIFTTFLQSFNNKELEKNNKKIISSIDKSILNPEKGSWLKYIREQNPKQSENLSDSEALLLSKMPVYNSLDIKKQEEILKEPDNYGSFIDFIKRFEGKTLDEHGNHIAFKGPNNQPLIGYGFAYTYDEEGNLVKVTLDDVGKRNITEEQANKILQQRIDKDIESLKTDFPKFDNFPKGLQYALIDIKFNTKGANKFRTTNPKLTALLDLYSENEKWDDKEILQKISKEANHDAKANGWLGVRSGSRSAMIVGDYDWNDNEHIYKLPKWSESRYSGYIYK